MRQRRVPAGASGEDAVRDPAERVLDEPRPGVGGAELERDLAVERAVRAAEPHARAAGRLARGLADAVPDESWVHEADDFWFHLRPRGRDGPVQEWKLHLSATPRTAEDVLVRAVAVLGRKRATRAVERYQALQDLLGEHQDGVVALDLLRSLTDGEAAFALGALHERERRAVARARRAAFRAAKRLG